MDAELAGLARALSGSVATDPAERARTSRDASHLTVVPRAVVRPADVDDVVALVRWARRTRVPLTARGAGTSLDGESVPAPGGVVVDFSGWSRLLDLDVSARRVRVGPGMVNRDLDRALAPSGLFFPPNPGSWTACTVGGNVATNAGGPRSYKYGTTARWVVGAEVVLGTGERLRLGSASPKRSVGPDLVQLVVGSEGTLGLVTEVELRLAPRPAGRAGLVVALPDERRLGACVASLRSTDAGAVAAVEFLDRETAAPLGAFDAAPIPPEVALLLVEVEGGSENGRRTVAEEVAARLRGVLPEAPRAIVIDDVDALWTWRGRAGLALAATHPDRIRDDVGVPIGRLDELLAAIRAIGRAHAIEVPTFGHVGDGNLHPNFSIDPASDVAADVRRDLYAATRRLGGTISAEHGIGALKVPFVTDELGPGAVRWLEAVRTACDPDRVLNPGKLLPGPGPGA